MKKSVKFFSEGSDELTFISTPQVINVKSADNDSEENYYSNRILKFSNGYLTREFIENFNNEYLDVKELDFSFEQKQDFSPKESTSITYCYSSEIDSKTYKKLDFQDAEYIAQMLRTNEGVEKISFKGQNIGDNGAYYILKALCNNPNNNVKEIDFRNCGITELTLVLIYYFLNYDNTHLCLSKIGVSNNLINSENYIIIEKLLSKEKLTEVEEWSFSIDTDTRNPFYYIRTREEKYGLIYADEICFQKIYFKKSSSIQQVDNVYKTVEKRKDPFLNIKLAFFYLAIIDFGNEENYNQLLKLKISNLMLLNLSYKNNLNTSERKLIEIDEQKIKQCLPDVYPEYNLRIKEKTCCFC